MIFGTGGMSHQISGPRAGLINSDFDRAFLESLATDPSKATNIRHIEYMREAGAEGIEMVMWLVARGALSDNVEESAPLLHGAGVEHGGGAPHPGRQGFRAERARGGVIRPVIGIRRPGRKPGLLRCP